MGTAPRGKVDGGFEGSREHLLSCRSPPGGGSPSNLCAPCLPPGVSEVDYCLYPAQETQQQWLRYYLQAQKGRAVTPREVERLYVQVNKFALVSA